MHYFQMYFICFLHGFIISEAVTYLFIKGNAVFNIQIVGGGGMKIDYIAIFWWIFGIMTAISLVCYIIP